MNESIFWLYRLVVMPMAAVLLPFVALGQSKLRLGMRLRRGRYEAFPQGVHPVWIHAASGEFEYAKAVIRELKLRDPQIPILVTYFSPTFAKTVVGFTGVDRAMALPLDLPGPCATFIRKMHPRLLLVARTDLWPEMLDRCRRNAIPVVVFSYTQKAFHSPLKRFFTTWVLHWIQRIYCVSPADLEILRALPLKADLAVLGDSRYDQVEYRLMHPKPLALTVRPSSTCLVAGSTWPEDEEVLLKGLAPLLQARSIKLILVPHEPTRAHLKDLSEKLKALSLDYTLYSTGEAWNEKPVLLVDRVGVLAELYALGEYAFVGGSFRKSVHSVMEALGAGAMTFVGPYHENNREAVEFKNLHFGSYPGVQVVANAEHLRAKLSAILPRPEKVREFARELNAEFNLRLGASAKLVDEVADLIWRHDQGPPG